MMTFIENMGVENMCESIRLDTFSMNEKNNNFYSRLGYEKLGQIYFRDQSDMPFNCYEKPLK
jgi:ribosomal protein S18 acetylase RimI-like enzyme